MVSAPPVSDPILAGLDPGEKEAIGLAVKTKAAWSFWMKRGGGGQHLNTLVWR